MAAAERKSGFQPSVIEGSGRRRHRRRNLHAASSTPPMGISRADDGADRRRRADQRHPEPRQRLVCPPDLIGTGEHFALEVKGDSMIDAGIHEGDIVIIKRQHPPITAISSSPWSRKKRRR